MGWWIFGSDENQSNETEEEQEDEYPKEYIEDAHIATTFTRTHATVHYKDGSTERITYDVRESDGRTITVSQYDHERDFHAKSSLTYFRNSEPSVYATKTGATEEEQTFNLDSVKKIEVNYRDDYVAFADVEKKVKERKDHRGSVETKAMLHTPQEEIEWSYMVKYEYEAMRERDS